MASSQDEIAPETKAAAGEIAAPEPATPTPEPQTTSNVTDRLETFFYYWSANRQDDMLTLCAPSWQNKVEMEAGIHAEGFEDYASLQAVHIYDTETIIDDLALIDTKLRMIGYVWDALTLQYKTVTLGTLNDLRDTVNKLRPT